MQSSIEENQKEEQAKIVQDAQLEEELREKGRIALIQIETEGKKYFKPKEDLTYRLTFDRAAALNVRGQPSSKLTREITDKKDCSKVIAEVPVMEWVYEITHISGNKQL